MKKKNKKSTFVSQSTLIEGDLVEYNIMLSLSAIVDASGKDGMEELIQQQNPYRGFELQIQNYEIHGACKSPENNGGSVVLQVRARLK